MIIEPSARPDCDIDYTFGQVAVDIAMVDYRSNCGNLSSAVGAFALDEGLIAAKDGACTVRMFNTNTKKRVLCHLDARGGAAAIDGDFAIDGVAGTGARIRLDFEDPGGAVSGRLLPTGRTVDEFVLADGRKIQGSLVDATNPVAFVEAQALGASASEQPSQLRANAALMRTLETIRGAAAVMMGLARNAEEATTGSPSSPKVAIVAAPAEARLLDGRTLPAGSIDIQVRMISMGVPHNAIPLTGAMCAAVAARLPGTLVHALCRGPDGAGAPVRIGHASGVLPVDAAVYVESGVARAGTATVFRTARRLMAGQLYVPRARLKPLPPPDPARLAQLSE
jgi:2-methylaconitate cis-trans-isomerase PrpF